jgi:hypothetical protein
MIKPKSQSYRLMHKTVCIANAVLLKPLQNILTGMSLRVVVDLLSKN